MTYKKNDVLISIEKVEGFGKNPGLWIGTEDPNIRVKMASFGSEDKAATFCKWLEYFLDLEDREMLTYETD